MNAVIGHNSRAMDASAAEQLRQIIERIERAEEEKAAIGADIKDVFAEGKSTGFDTKAMRGLIRLRKKEPHEREEEEQLVALYGSALGMSVGGIGHNGGPTLDSAAAEQLRSLIQRIERLEEEKAAVAADIKDIYTEAKGTGFDTKTIRKLIRLRKKEPHEREEEEQLLELYRAAVGV